MNVNELRTAILNHQIKIEEEIKQIAFTNSEIVLLDNYTVRDVVYDQEKNETKLLIEAREPVPI